MSSSNFVVANDNPSFDQQIAAGRITVPGGAGGVVPVIHVAYGQVERGSNDFNDVYTGPYTSGLGVTPLLYGANGGIWVFDSYYGGYEQVNPPNYYPGTRPYGLDRESVSVARPDLGATVNADKRALKAKLKNYKFT